MPVALVDTTVLYAAGGREHNRLGLSQREIENGREIVEEILAGDLPKAHIITPIEQETLDHIAEDAGLEDMVVTSDAWLANDNIDSSTRAIRSSTRDGTSRSSTKGSNLRMGW